MEFSLQASLSCSGLDFCLQSTWCCRSWIDPLSPAGSSCPGSAQPGSRSCCTRLTGCGSGRWRGRLSPGPAVAAARSAGKCPGTGAGCKTPTGPSLPGGDDQDLEELVLQQVDRSQTCQCQRSTNQPGEEGNVQVQSGPAQVQVFLSHGHWMSPAGPEKHKNRSESGWSVD